jgi:hypothetical protein
MPRIPKKFPDPALFSRIRRLGATLANSQAIGRTCLVARRVSEGPPARTTRATQCGAPSLTCRAANDFRRITFSLLQPRVGSRRIVDPFDSGEDT